MMKRKRENFVFVWLGVKCRFTIIELLVRTTC
mgnify:CR=1 FL=1